VRRIGVYFGQAVERFGERDAPDRLPSNLTSEQGQESIKRRDEGQEMRAEIPRRYKVDPSTISRLTTKKQCVDGSR
jgi:CENP-B N-terminal DNA-binding domain